MPATRVEDLPGWAQSLIRDARVGHLGLVDAGGAPRVLPVTFVAAEGGLWTAVDHKRKREPGRELARVRWLRTRSEAALTVDVYDEDWSSLAWVQALCEARIHESPPVGVLDGLAEKYPQYADNAPAGPFIELRPHRFLHWRASPEE